MLPVKTPHNPQRDEDYTDVEVDVDEDTGFPQPESLQIDDIAANQEIISTANYLEEMEATVGWNILIGYLGEEVNSLLQILRKESDLEKIRRIQSLIQSFEIVPGIVRKLKSSAKQASTSLAQYIMTGTAGE